MFEGIRCYDTPKGPAVFRLEDHLVRLHELAPGCSTWIFPYTVAEMRAATHEVICRERLPRATSAPRVLRVRRARRLDERKPRRDSDHQLPVGRISREEGQEHGITAKISSWERVGPNVIPHVCKATGIYLNSMLATTEAAAADRRGDHAHRRRHIADGPGENIFVVKDGVIGTPPLSTSILPGSRVTRSSRSRRTSATALEETLLIRTDLYLADEVFMTGTATEVAPVRRDRRPGDRRRAGHARAAEARTWTTVNGRERALEPAGSTWSRCHPPRRRLTATRTVALSSPWLDEREEELVAGGAALGRLSLGPTIDRFEEEFAEAVGAPYAAAVSSGTAGLHLLCRSPASARTTRSITSPYSFVASANCAIYEGRRPSSRTWIARTLNLDPACRRGGDDGRTRAVVAVDIYGYPCELDELRALCCDRGIALIEDACEALGARYKGAPIGSQGASAVFAFYPNKQMTTGEGGVVTTHSEDEWRLLRSLRNQGRADAGGWLEHARLGFNYRMDDIRAAIGIGQLEKLDEILARRRRSPRATRSFSARFRASSALRRRRGSRAFLVRVRRRTPRGGRPRGRDRGLDAHGVQTARYLPCIHLQPYMQERFGFRGGLCPVAEELSARTLALPFHARLGQDDQEYVAAALESALTSGAGHLTARRDTLPGQGEALAAWAMWGTTTLAVLVTYSRVDPAEHVQRLTRQGLGGGLGRALDPVNFPIALVADRARARRRRRVAARAPGWAAAPTIVCCALVPLSSIERRSRRRGG